MSATLFESAVAQYARYRSGYPAEQVALLAARLRLGPAGRAIDVGCGSGQFTLPLARRVGSVDAIDPVAGMLAAGRSAAQAAGLTNITWSQGDSTGIADLVAPGASLAVFAASFHWTDRVAVLRDLAAILAPGASVVVVNDDLDDSAQPDWVHAIAEVRSRYPGLNPAPGAVNKLPESHRSVLARSAFSAVSASTWSWTRSLDLDQVVGLQLTYSFSTPALLGDRVADFSADVRAAVLRLHPRGVVTEPFRMEVLVASGP